MRLQSRWIVTLGLGALASLATALPAQHQAPKSDQARARIDKILDLLDQEDLTPQQRKEMKQQLKKLQAEIEAMAQASAARSPFAARGKAGEQVDEVVREDAMKQALGELKLQDNPLEHERMAKLHAEKSLAKAVEGQAFGERDAARVKIEDLHARIAERVHSVEDLEGADLRTLKQAVAELKEGEAGKAANPFGQLHERMAKLHAERAAGTDDLRALAEGEQELAKRYHDALRASVAERHDVVEQGQKAMAHNRAEVLEQQHREMVRARDELQAEAARARDEMAKELNQAVEQQQKAMAHNRAEILEQQHREMARARDGAQAEAARVRDEMAKERSEASEQRAKERAQVRDRMVQDRVRVRQSQPARGEAAPTPGPEAGDDDAELRAMVREVREEMAQIRQLVQQIQRRAEARAQRTEADEATPGSAPSAPSRSRSSSTGRARRQPAPMAAGAISAPALPGLTPMPAMPGEPASAAEAMPALAPTAPARLPQPPGFPVGAAPAPEALPTPEALPVAEPQPAPSAPMPRLRRAR